MTARTLDKDMLDAVKSGANFSRGNTQVKQHEGGTSKVLLHGHKVLEYSPNSGLKFCWCGYPTGVTTSRLKAIIEWYTDNKVTVNIRKGIPVVTVQGVDGLTYRLEASTKKWHTVTPAGLVTVRDKSVQKVSIGEV